MLHSFRVLPKFVPSQTRASFSSSTAASVKFNKRRAASAAVVFTVTSATALAASNNNHHENALSASTAAAQRSGTFAINSNHKRSWSSVVSSLSATNPTMTDCEGTTSKTAAATAASETTTIPDYLLKFDHYNGVIIHLDWIFHHPNATTTEKSNHGNEKHLFEKEKHQQEHNQDFLDALYHEWNEHPDKFERILERSIQQWKTEGRKGIWVHMPKDMAGLVPGCVKHGFNFHSCQNHNRLSPLEDENGDKRSSTTLILAQWLPTEIASRLPLGPYFQAGVGCIVLHPDDPSKMLVVKELTGPAAARDLWKMPTGLIDPGEDVAEASLRELEEETGLKGATCEGVLAFRQAHGASAGRAASDLFFVVLLRAPSSKDQQDLDNLKPQEHEIAAIQWMPVKDYTSQEIWLKSPVYMELNQAVIEASENEIAGKPTPVVTPHKLDVGWMGGTNTVYRSNL